MVAALLLIQNIFIHNKLAVAAENNEHSNRRYADANHKPKSQKAFEEASSKNSRKAEKIIVMLKSIGISDRDTMELVNDIDARTNDGHFLLHEEKISSDFTNGSLSLRYDLQPRIKTKMLELHYTPDNSNTEYSIRTNSVMVNYNFSF